MMPSFVRVEGRQEDWALVAESLDGATGESTMAGDEWTTSLREQIAYLRLVLETGQQHFDMVWRQIQSESGSGSSAGAIDVLFDRLGGLLPHDYEWMALAAAVRDGVTSYEVYLTKAFDEVLAAHGLVRRQVHRTPGWLELSENFAMVGLKARPPQVDHIVRLRDILTHRRGELRTKADRKRFADADGWADDLAHLDQPKVLGFLQTLGECVSQIDPVMWRHSYGGHRFGVLQGVAEPEDQLDY